MKKTCRVLPQPNSTHIIKAEALRLWELYQAGLARELYFRADTPAAVLVLECASLEEAKQALATLPLVQAGLIHFDVIPLLPYPGFARPCGNPGLRFYQVYDTASLPPTREWETLYLEDKAEMGRLGLNLV